MSSPSPSTNERPSVIKKGWKKLTKPFKGKKNADVGSIPGRAQSSAVNVLSSSRASVADASASTPENLQDTGKDMSQKKLMAQEVASFAWSGFKLLVKNANEVLEGTPLKLPVQIINNLIEIAEGVADNNDKIKEILQMTDQRLKRIFEDIAKWKDMDGIQSCFGHFCKALTDADIHLRKMNASGLIKQTVQSSDNKEEIERILKSIDNATQNFQLDITLLNIRLTQEIKDNTEISRLKSLNTDPSFEAQHSKDGRDRCVEGTRKDIIENILSWCKDLSPESPSIYWLNGMAGTGKSTIALTICDILTKENKATRLGASFFCSRQVQNRGKQANVIPAIAYQLALSFPPFGRALLDAKLDAQPISVKEHSKRMLIEPWKAAISEHVAPIIVVIDALDELEGMEGSQFFQNLMALMAEETNSVWLKFFITSRQDPKIVEMAQKLPPIVRPRLQDIEDIVVEKDIILYLRDALPELNEDDYLKVARQSAGLFIFAATMVRFILGPSRYPPSPGKQRDQLGLMLKAWPNTDQRPDKGLAVDTLYEEILEDYLKPMAPVDCKAYLKILQTIMCTKVPLMATEIATLCCSPGPLKKEDICNMVFDLHAVLYLFEDHVFTYHKSFVDFMSNVSRLHGHQMRAIFDGYPQDICHYDLTIKSFDVMQDLEFNICKLPSSFQNDSEIKDLPHRIKTNIPKALQYACQYWSAHLASSMKEKREGIATKFCTWMDTKSIFWIEVMNLMRMVGKCHAMLMEVQKYVKVLPEQRKDIIALANMTKIFGSNSVSESTPHLYISALPVLRSFLGEGSTWNTWVQNIPKLTGHASLNQLVVISHGSEVYSVAFSPDGTQIVSGSYDKSVRIWDASTGKEMHKLEGHTSWVSSVAFSPDGTQIVSGSYDQSVRIWDASTGKEMHKLEGHTHSSVRIWDASTGKEMHKLEGHTHLVNSVAFSPDGTQIVSGSDDQSVRIWDASTGKEIHKLEGHTDSVLSAAFSPDGTQIVSGSYDKSVRIWDASTGKEMHKLEGHTDSVSSVAFSPDGTQIVSGSYDQSVRIWDASTGKEMHKLEGHTHSVSSVAFSPDGTQIVSGSYDKSVRIWDASTGKEMHKLEGHTDSVLSVAFSPDGTQIVSGSYDQSVRIWDASTGKEMHKLEGHTDSVSSVAFSPDGTQIVSGSYDQSVRIWDASTGKEMHKLEGHTSWVSSVAFSPDGTQIVSGSYDQSVRIWDASTGKEMHKLEGHTHLVNSVAFSPDGTQIVSGSDDQSVRIWDASTGKEMHKLEGHTDSVLIWDASTGREMHKLEGHTDSVLSAAFSPDGTQIVSGSYDKSVRIWDASTGKEMHKLEGHTDSVSSVAFSPDGTQIVSGSYDQSVRIWDASTGKEMHKLEGHTHLVNSVAFSPDGTQIVSGSDDQSVRIWNASTGKEMHKLEGHPDSVSSVAFSPDGTQIVSGSYDQSVRIWDASTGKEMHKLEGHTHSVLSVAFSPDGTQIIQPANGKSIEIQDSWYLNNDGWIMSSNQSKLMWLPPVMRPYTNQPHCRVISSSGCIDVDFSNTFSGTEWGKCYADF
ncbi:hypothetical protein BT96DRAFT_886390 [Gymnopus androsaceus JB14]|uniref:Nephrocystin 3-like N-terminal domain-containing protein n=1 Tax=Gymnopus androsaceus JB14 TaxID=1447944 RepID=A0A6A4HBL5_9AGAR|nr:hypothetical protein BT96DRAFT_886390 [Gymnopus androsaceus JB14]